MQWPCGASDVDRATKGLKKDRGGSANAPDRPSLHVDARRNDGKSNNSMRLTTTDRRNAILSVERSGCKRSRWLSESLTHSRVLPSERRDRLKPHECGSLTGVVEYSDHDVADADGVGLAADDVGHHSRAFFELDVCDHVRDGVTVFARATPGRREAIHSPAPACLDPLEVGRAACGTDSFGVPDHRVALRAPREKEAPLGS